jgi:hypothetical protein
LTVFDGTTSLTEPGPVKFLSPLDLAPLAKFDATPRFWVRARSAENDPFDTQRLQGVFLNATAARQAVSVADEPVGSSNAQPSQQLRLARPPVLTGQQVLVREPEPPAEQERLAIEAEEGPDAVQERINPVTGAPEIWVRWHEVNTFLRSDSRSRHYLLDHTSGLLSFGDGRHGLIPPPGTNNVSASYASGGGTSGNLPKGAIGKIQTPLPGLATVTNPIAADGGAARETVEQVKERGPWTLRHRQRAVATGDLEWLAREAAGTQVARVRVLPNVNRDLRFEPGWASLVIVPRGTEAKLSPGPELIRAVQSFLQARAFVGSATGTPARINVIGPGYLQVVVAAQIVPFDIDQAELVEQAAIAALDAFFHPLTGGPRGTGWEFARDVYESEISQVLEGVVGVSHVKTLDLLPNQAQHRLAIAATLTATAALPAGSLVVTIDGRKAALLAEPVPAGLPLAALAVKGFREGDRLARVRDLAGATPGQPIVEAGAIIPTIDVSAFPADPVGFPRGSRLATLDGRLQTRLARAIPRAPAGGSQLLVTSLAVEDEDFVAGLLPPEQLTVFYPFPVVVTAVTLDGASGTQTLAIEPYEAEVEFPSGSLLASLDNRARLPLAEPLAAGGPTTSIRLHGFQAGEQLRVASLHGMLTIQRVDQVTDVVYLDDNFLVQPGRHRITMRAD